MSTSKLPKEVWIGLVGMKPKPGSTFFDEGIKGAYAQILAWADSTTEYKAQIEEALNFYHLYLHTIDNVEPLAERLSKYVIDDYLLELANEVRTTGNARFGTFHEFENEE